jgi:arsenate reductase-like glutaredoxin family protein
LENIHIYFLKKDFDAQKTERFFKERRIPCAAVDLEKRAIGKRELQSVAAQVGVQNLINTSAKAYETSPIRMLHGTDAILDALIANPKMLKLPIVRNGSKATVGFNPDVWEKWIAE